jgi:hypothetical protein
VVGFPAETGEDAELARVKAPDWESGDDEDHPRYAPPITWLPGVQSSSRVAMLRSAGAQRPLRQVVRTIRGDWLGLETEDRNQWAVPRREATPRKRRGRPAFGPRGPRRPSMVATAGHR